MPGNTKFGTKLSKNVSKGRGMKSIVMPFIKFWYLFLFIFSTFGDYVSTEEDVKILNAAIFSFVAWLFDVPYSSLWDFSAKRSHFPLSTAQDCVMTLWWFSTFPFALWHDHKLLSRSHHNFQANSERIRNCLKPDHNDITLCSVKRYCTFSVAFQRSSKVFSFPLLQIKGGSIPIPNILYRRYQGRI